MMASFKWSESGGGCGPPNVNYLGKVSYIIIRNSEERNLFASWRKKGQTYVIVQSIKLWKN